VTIGLVKINSSTLRMLDSVGRLARFVVWMCKLLMKALTFGLKDLIRVLFQKANMPLLQFVRF